MDQIIPAPAPTRTEMGNLSSLTTTQKGSIVGAINEVDAEVSALNSKFEWSNSGVKDISTGFQVPSWAKEIIVQGTKSTGQSFAVWEVVSVHMPITGEANNSSASGYGSTMLTVYINSSNQLSIVQSATSNIAYYRVFYR